MDYRSYHLSVKEKCLYSIVYVAFAILIGKVFYDDIRAALLVFLLLPYLLRRKAEKIAKERREKLALEFKEYILAFCGSLKTGYSVENACVQAGKDLVYMLGEDADMVKECRKMETQFQNNKLAETWFSDLGIRSGQEDIKDFAAIFVIAKKSGGNMGTMIRNTANVISEKIEVKREIQLLYAAKRMEQTIMNVVPIAIIGYVRMTSPDYFDGMYHNPFGVFVMTICLLVYGMAYVLSEKIMNIEV